MNSSIATNPEYQHRKSLYEWRRVQRQQFIIPGQEQILLSIILRNIVVKNTYFSVYYYVTPRHRTHTSLLSIWVGSCIPICATKMCKNKNGTYYNKLILYIRSSTVYGPIRCFKCPRKQAQVNMEMTMAEENHQTLSKTVNSCENIIYMGEIDSMITELVQ